MSEFIIVLKQDAIMCAQLTQHLLVDMDEVAHSQSALLHWLNRHDVKRVKVIIDLLEEELYVDRHPSLFPWEMKAYAERQQHRRFPSTEFSRHLYTQAPKLPWQPVAGELWLSGFNEDDMIQKLLTWLDDAQVMVSALYSSMSVLKTMMMKTWFSRHARQAAFQHQAMVLLVRTSDQDFRQLLLVNGQIRTNRQIHVEARELPEQMRLLIQEVNLLDKFAKAQKLLDQSAKLRLFYVGREAEDKQQAILAFQQSVFAEGSTKGHFADIQSLIADMHLSQLYDRLLVLTLSSARLSSDYRPKIVQQVDTIKKSTLTLWLSWKVAFLLLIGYGLSYLTHQHETEQATKQLMQLKQSQQDYIARYMAYNDLTFLTNYTVEEIKQFVDGVDNIKQLQQHQDLLRVWKPLSQVLSAYPDVSLMKMSLPKPSIKNGTKELQLIDASFQRVYLSLIFHASSQQKLVDMLAQVDKFVLALQSVESSRIKSVVMSQKPLDLDSGKALKLNLDDKPTLDRIPLPFEIVVELAND